MEFVTVRFYALSIFVILCFSVCWGLSEGVPEFEKCKEYLTNSLFRKQMEYPYFIGIVGLFEFDKRINDEFGLVYSELKYHHRLFQLFPLLSDDGKDILRRFLKLGEDKSCDQAYCIAYYNIIDTILKRQNKDVIYETSLCYSSDQKVRKGLELEYCFTSQNPFYFGRSGKDLTSSINSAYASVADSETVRYQHKNFNPQANFFIAGGVTVKPSLFKDYDYISSDVKFTNVDNNQQSVRWLKVSGRSSVYTKVGVGIKLKIYRTEMNSEGLYMMYFKPIYDSATNAYHRKSDIRSVFIDLQDYVKMSGETVTSLSSLAVPYINIKSEIDLKPILESQSGYNLNRLFKENMITELYQCGSHPIHELRMADYFVNLGSHADPKTDFGTIEEFVDSAFVFAVVDGPSNMILKAGGFWRVSEYQVMSTMVQ